ncbi:unnamed protein product [Bursaphelenchus okinawaensis]|uniref:EGF-like domain-containing protein n=1 Tax=Bursaphelenchus okinawaensis TaxID=465554 RepID=A0A811K5M3_9BILA|nr:unnamed protein product [Bursaphelenchus okinawaensis]CAG9091241.1 unnamed protein product [Bursaphelenchus okinawaensis]
MCNVETTTSSYYTTTNSSIDNDDNSTSSSSSFSSSSSTSSTPKASATPFNDNTSSYDICSAVTESAVCYDCIHGNFVCENNGTCGWYGNTSVCDCEYGYSGDYCEVTEGCASSPCLNGGACTNVNTTGYECECLSIYNGTNCDIYDPCSATPCVNGDCINNGNATYYCNCTTGYNGTFCDTIIDYCDDDPCMYNSTCTSYIGYYDCQCLDGSSGEDCEILTDNCIVNSTSNTTTVCNSRDEDATCTNGFNTYNCTCSSQWAGANCTIPIQVWQALQYFPDQSESVALFLENIYGDPQAIEKAAPYVIATLDQTNVTANGWSLDETVIWAAFEQRIFNKTDNFYVLTDASLGNCFTFNHPDNQFTFQLRNSGETNGFSALMKVNQDEYLPWLDIAMMSIYVHAYDTLVFVESLSFDAIPGGFTALKVSKSTYTRLGGNFDECAASTSDVTSYFYPGNYTSDACLWSCYQMQVNASCGCMDPRYLMPKRGAYQCGLSDAVCVFNVTDVLGDPSTWSTCDCPTECEAIQYDVQWDGAGFPDSPVECSAYDDNSTAYQTCLTNFQDYAQVSVYFPDITQTTYAETAKWTVNNIMAYFGGLVGAVMGFSFVSVIELAFLVYRCLLVLCTNESATLEEVDVGGVDEDENHPKTTKIADSIDLLEQGLKTEATETGEAKVPEAVPPSIAGREPAVAPDASNATHGIEPSKPPTGEFTTGSPNDVAESTSTSGLEPPPPVPVSSETAQAPVDAK